MKVRVAPDLCCGAQRCAIVAPEFYTLVDGYNALVGQSEPQSVPPELEQVAVRGARACPESAIQIIEGED
ncbi:MAG: 4Fe-4S single cluster domain [Phenylobacterium sp.]|nr:4Fe-4S single cluster domain [Phenylobacterium sp.]